MALDSTVTSPERTAAVPGVTRLVLLRAPAGAGTEASRVLEAPLVMSRSGTEQGDAAACIETLGVDDPEVSRRHALLEPGEHGAWRVVDEGSHNGTFVNGVRVQARDLACGDVLRLGGHLWLLQSLDLAAGRRLGRRRVADSPLVGEGPAVKAVDEQVRSFAREDAPVVILGETGTGKELVTQQLHAMSGRRGPLLAVNCTALTETVADSELFGHVKGAFSGALRTRDGLFAAATGGTLFLDEIGDLPLSIQAKLLRTLETGEIRRVGDNQALRTDARVVAATHVDLEAAVAAGAFRADLWARLQRLVIRVPALRGRRDDVLPLARHFLAGLGARHTIDVDAAEALVTYAWPYNVRELRNVMEFAVRGARGGRAITRAQLPPRLAEHGLDGASSARPLPVGRAPRDAEELQRLLDHVDWNVAQAAALIGKDRKQIYRWCERFGVVLDRGN